MRCPSSVVITASTPSRAKPLVSPTSWSGTGMTGEIPPRVMCMRRSGPQTQMPSSATTTPKPSAGIGIRAVTRLLRGSIRSSGPRSPRP
jgi:hypothetical protein